MNYLDWGNPGAQTILFLHGALQQGHSWDFVALPLATDYHCIALDARGHGDSQWASDGDYSLEAHQGDLEGLMDALGLDQFILVGHSMGGRNSYVYTSRHPEKVKALVIVDTGPQTDPAGQRRIQQFRELPDELDSFPEFADRVQQYTGPAAGASPWSAEVQYPGALRRQMDLEVRQATAYAGRAALRLAHREAVGVRGLHPVPHVDHKGRQQRYLLLGDHGPDASADPREHRRRGAQRGTPGGGGQPG